VTAARRAGKSLISNADGGTGIGPVWSPNGDELFYRSGAKMMAVDIDLGEQLMLGTPKVLFEQGSDFVKAYDVADDGRFVMVQERERNPPPDHLILVQHFAEELKRLVPTDMSCPAASPRVWAQECSARSSA